MPAQSRRFGFRFALLGVAALSCVLVVGAAADDIAVPAPAPIVGAVAAVSESGAPRVAGVGRQGRPLKVSGVGGLADRGAEKGVEYQWLRCDAAGDGCVEIEGTRLESYTPGGLDVGHSLRLRVSVRGGGPSDVSDPSTVVPAEPPAVGSGVRVFGGTAAGSVLGAEATTWFGTAPFDLSYQWFQCDRDGVVCVPMFNGSNAAYTVTAGDVKAGSVVAEITATNSVGSASDRSAPFLLGGSGGSVAPLSLDGFGGSVAPLSLGPSAWYRTLGVCDVAPTNQSSPTTNPSGVVTAGNQIGVASAGSWTPLGCGTTYTYAWFQDGGQFFNPSGALLVDNVFSPSPWTTTAGQATHTVLLQVTAYNAGPGASARSTPVTVNAPPNSAPYFVDNATYPGPDFGTTPAAGPVEMQYNDPDGHSGTVTVTVTDWDTGVVRSQKSFPNIPSQVAQTLYMDTPFVGHVKVTFTATDSLGLAASNNGIWIEMWATNIPTTPTLVSPASAATVTSPSPALTVTTTDPDSGDTPIVKFRLSKIAACTTAGGSDVVANSGWVGTLPTAGGPRASWSPPSGLLTDNTTYWWCAYSADPKITFGSTLNWSASRPLTVRIPGLGTRSQWPMWQRGPLAVNEATGNLFVGLPAPSYPTGIGDLSMSVAYNSLDARANLFGLGDKWILGTLGDVPARLYDHNLFSQTPPATDFYDGIERVNSDGSSDYFSHVGNANSGYYVSEDGNRSQLFKNPDGTWTLTDEDGSIYTFRAPVGSETFYRLASAEVAAGKNPNAVVAITPDSQGRVLKMEAKVGTTVLAALDFNWACAGALLCVTGPDGRAWQYIGETGATGRLRTVRLAWSGGSRDIARVAYDASNRIVGYETANDIADTVAGWQATHQVVVSYNAQGKVQDVTDGPIRSSLGGGTISPKWSFTYTPGNVAVTTSAAPHPSTGSAVARTASGFTEVCPPRQQPTCTVKDIVFYDSQWQTMETRNLDRPIAGVTKVNYDGSGRVTWSEDELGKPTDVTFDPVTSLVTKSEGPDPDAGGSQQRLATLYRYDEKAIGSVATAGTALAGLQAAYYSNQNLTGRPVVLQTDATVDATWASAPASGVVADNFSVRWRGLVNLTTAGDYKFSTVATGGTRLYIDGTQLIDKWGSQTGEVCSVEASLTVGKHQVMLEYKDSGSGSANVQLRRTAAFQYPTSPACTDGGAAEGTVVAAADLMPNYGNQTTTIGQSTTNGPPDRLSFSHFAEPWLGVSDYSLVLNGAEQLITSYTYDAFGRMVSKVMPKGNSARMISTTPGATEGDLSGAIDAKFQTDWVYYAPTDTQAWDTACGSGPAATGQMGLLKSLTTYGVAPVTTVYDSGGRVLSADSGERVKCNTFAADGRLSSEKAKTNSGSFVQTSYSYDPDGNTLTTADPSGTLTNVSNEAGGLLEGTDATGGATPANGANVRPTYDLEGNVTTRVLQMPSAGATYTSSYVYDAENRVTSQTDPAGRQYTFLYDARGALKVTNYNVGTAYPTTRWEVVNDAGWVMNARLRHGTSTLAAEAADATPIAEYAYAYFQNGQRSSQTRTGVAGSELTSYVYDPVGRLEQANLAGGTSRRYCFDKDSNRTGYTAAAATLCSGALAATYNYNNLTTPGVDQLSSVTQGAATTSYAYDTDGNVTGRGGDTIGWDAYGRHSSFSQPGITGVQYAVDGTNDGPPIGDTSPYVKQVSGLTAGYRTIGATATNRAGKTAKAHARVVRVAPSTPTAALIAQLGSAVTTTTASTISLAVTAAAPVGSTVVVAAGQTDTTLSSLTDSRGNSYTVDRSTVTNGSDADARVAIGSARLTTALQAGDTITATFAANTKSVRVISAAAFSGLATTGWADQSATNTTGSGTSLTSGTSPTTTNHTELVIGAFGTAAATTGTFTASNGFTAANTNTALNTGHVQSDDLGVHLAWKVVTTTGTQQATGSLTISGAYAGALQTYKTDSVLPGAPGTPAVTSTPGTASLSWTASSESGVAYNVYRGTSSGFTADSSSEIGQTTATSFVDNGDGTTFGLTGGPYFYKLVAEDLQSNRSTVTAAGASGTITADGTLPRATITTLPANQITLQTSPLTVSTTADDSIPTKTVAYTFDPAGFRLKRIYTENTTTTTTNYLLGGLIETDGAGILTLFDVDGPAGDLARYTAPPTTGQTAVTFAFYDGHGDLAAETTTSPTGKTNYSYDPFGAPLQAPAANVTTERWTGRWDKKLDTTTSLIEMGARPYDPALGRFLAVDPVEGGSANTYDYAAQDPINGYDLDGRCFPACLVLAPVAVVGTASLVVGYVAVTAAGAYVGYKVYQASKGKKPKAGSPNQANEEIRRGTAPPGIRRVDRAHPGRQQTQDHAHFDDGSVLNRDGTASHGSSPNPNRRQRGFLRRYGFRV